MNFLHILALAVFPIYAICEEEPVSALLAEGTELTVRVIDHIHTEKRGGVRVGDQLTFHLVNEVAVDGHIVLERGDVVFGTVTKARRSGVFGRKGKLAFRFDYVLAIDGQKIPLGTEPQKTKGEAKLGGRSPDTLQGNQRVIVADVLPLVAKGNDAYIDKGTEFQVIVARDVKVSVK